MTVAHELLHGWELRHSHGERCLGDTEDQEGDAIDMNGWGFTNGDKLDPRGWLPGRTPSRPFVTKSPSFGPPPFSSNLYDVMSYCADSAQERWIAPAMWRRALAQRQKRKGAGSRLLPWGAEAAQAAAMSPASEVERGYTASVRAAQAGEVLAPNGATALRVLRAAVEIGRREATPSAPRVRLRLPRRPTVVRGGPLRVSWAARDADGPAPLATVSYSADGGRAWRTVAQTARASITVARSQLAPSRRALVRITVSDGFHERVGRSPSTPPPASHARIAAAFSLCRLR